MTSPTPLILIVEDDLAIRESLRDLLVEEGYRVAEADHGAQALERLAEETPSLIILDLWMPVMTGGELMEKLRADARWASLPVLVLTAANEEADPALTTLRKPVGLETLLAAVSAKLPK